MHRTAVADSMSISSSDWQVEVDRATPAEWSKLLELFDDANIYQTSAYGEVRWGEKNLSRIVLKRSGTVVGMAQLRIIRPIPLNFGIAYLRWGPLWERRGIPFDPDVPARMVRAIEEEYAGRRRLYLRVRPNAFVGSQRAAIMQAAFYRFSAEPLRVGNEYRTLVLDLAPSLDELRKGFDSKWRNKLSGAERNKLEVIGGSGTAEYRTFCKIYEEMRRRKRFESTVNVNDFGRIQENLVESQRMRVLICQDKGIPVAGLVASAIGDSAIYLLGATSDAGLKFKGAYLLQWTLICWLKERGIKSYDLGGVDPDENPGVYSFKRGLSGVDICQVGAIAATHSVVSSGLVMAGLALRRAIRTFSKPLSFGNASEQPVARS